MSASPTTILQRLTDILYGQFSGRYIFRVYSLLFRLDVFGFLDFLKYCIA